MKLLQIGNRILNLETISHATYDPAATVPDVGDTWTECIVSFGQDDCQIFYGDEAETVWSFLKPFCTSFVINRDRVA